MAYQQPYLKPKLPFTGCIQGGLCEGKTITLTGRVMPGASRFHVNLQCGRHGSADIALHFNPRYSFGLNMVVCNTRQGSSYGAEEWHHHNPIQRGSDFSITFLVNRDSYSVIVNGAHFLEYLHRIPFSRVDAISVEGGADIQSISFQNPVSHVAQPTVFSGARAPKKVAAAAAFTAAPPPYSPPNAYIMPYKTVIQGGLYPGRVIAIYGFVNHDADRFNINLRCNSGIAFHFNPRFNENVVVRNSMLNQHWGREEREGGMPFYRGQSFELTIICDTQWYKIMVNGVQMFTYTHRHYLLQQIDILEVQGNVSLNSVSF